MARDMEIELRIKTKWTTEILKDASYRKLIPSFEEFKQILNDLINIGL